MTEETQVTEPTVKVESKPKTAKKKSKAKKVKKDSHEGRPKSSLTYWKAAIEGNRLRGEDLAYAIKKIEEYEKQKEQKRLSRTKPNTGNALRSILAVGPKVSAPVAKNADVAKSALYAEPQTQETPLELTAALEPAPLAFDDVLEQIAEQSRNSESVADIAKRLRVVPTAEHDSITETRIWAAVHGMKVR